jgi:hypothetical protein
MATQWPRILRARLGASFARRRPATAAAGGQRANRPDPATPTPAIVRDSDASLSVDSPKTRKNPTPRAISSVRHF